VPVVFYGDEQGFAGVGGDQAARQDMFASQVASYNAQPLVGTARTTAEANFNPDHPIYRAIAELANLRASVPALRRGRQIVRAYGPRPGLFAVSRIDPVTGEEILIAFNTSTRPLTAQVLVNATSRRFASLHGRCAAEPAAPGSLTVSLAPLDFIICRQTP
jgi:glycosidase